MFGVTELGGLTAARRKRLKTMRRPKKPHVYATIRIPSTATLP
jgi:hypothetical protein